jgi:ankyrin repeat protein
MEGLDLKIPPLKTRKGSGKVSTDTFGRKKGRVDSTLFSHILKNDLKSVKEMFDVAAEAHVSRLLSDVDPNGMTPLHLACSLGNISMVELLLEQPEVSLNGKDSAGRDPLDLAIAIGHPGIIKLLFAARAQGIDFSDDDYGGGAFPSNSPQSAPKSKLN